MRKITTKTASKRVAQQTAEATGDLIGNKIVDKITSLDKSKEKGGNKESRINLHWWFEFVLSINCDFLCIKMEFLKIVNLFDTSTDDKNLPRFVTKKWIEVHDQSEKNYNVNKKIRIKTPMLRSDLCGAYIFVKGKHCIQK